MNILIATHDLEARKAHLMPWRVIAEAASGLRDRACNVSIVSLVKTGQGDAGKSPPPGIIVISKNRQELPMQLAEFVEKNAIDVVFWPLTWREPKWRIDIVGKLRIAKVGYIPSGVYSFRTSLYALSRIGWRSALPYIVDSLMPNRRLTHLARLAGFTDMITFSALTAEVLRDAGWSPDHVHCVPPGKELRSSEDAGELPVAVQKWLGESPFFLFMGPPSGIRGIYELLAAFEKAAARSPDFRLICLFRPDDRLESDRIKRIIDHSVHAHRIYAAWEMIDRATLDAYISQSTAIAMPFVLVPSEIPLAIIEALGFGRPIIATSPSGTGEFVARFGFAPRVGDTGGLAEAMLTLVESADIHTEKCRAAALANEELVSWSEMAGRWLQVAQIARSSASAV